VVAHDAGSRRHCSPLALLTPKTERHLQFPFHRSGTSPKTLNIERHLPFPFHRLATSLKFLNIERHLRFPSAYGGTVNLPIRQRMSDLVEYRLYLGG
jgi:hypothetical protein